MNIHKVQFTLFGLVVKEIETSELIPIGHQVKVTDEMRHNIRDKIIESLFNKKSEKVFSNTDKQFLDQPVYRATQLNNEDYLDFINKKYNPDNILDSTNTLFISGYTWDLENNLIETRLKKP